MLLLMTKSVKSNPPNLPISPAPNVAWDRDEIEAEFQNDQFPTHPVVLPGSAGSHRITSH